MTFAVNELLWAVLGLLALLLLLLLVFIFRTQKEARALREDMNALEDSLSNALEVTRNDFGEALSATRLELSRSVALTGQGASQQIQALTGHVSREMQASGKLLSDWTGASNEAFSTMREKLNGEFRALQSMISGELGKIRSENEEKLEAIRGTVSEKLDKTLNDRLEASFRTLDAKLLQVQQNLGEMRAVADHVRELQHVLSNVKTRGIFGETQLSAILSEVLSPGQYGEQVQVVPDEPLRVDFAVRLPGRGADSPCWLPVDAKFPLETWERLREVSESADPEALRRAQKELERAVLREAASIGSKYIRPPYTTDFAVMFLPSEGLYAEVLRIPALADRMQRECRVTPAGPVVFTALLNSLMMGFMTLAMEERSVEVWSLLSGVKTEFEDFTRQFGLLKKKFLETQKTLDAMGRQSQKMERSMASIDSAAGGVPALEAKTGDIPF